MDFSFELGQLNGRMDGHDQEIGGMRSQLADIHGSVGRIEGMLQKVVESGPHPILVAPQPALEPSGSSVFSRANRLLSNPKSLHIFYGMLLLIALMWILSAYTGRPIDTFVANPWDKTTARPHIP